MLTKKIAATPRQIPQHPCEPFVFVDEQDDAAAQPVADRAADDSIEVVGAPREQPDHVGHDARVVGAFPLLEGKQHDLLGDAELHGRPTRLWLGRGASPLMVIGRG